MIGEKETKNWLSFSSLSPKIIKNENLFLNKIHNTIVQKFRKSLVKWHLSLFFKMFRLLPPQRLKVDYSIRWPIYKERILKSV